MRGWPNWGILTHATTDYRKFRRFFDSLRYASNHSRRYFSFVHAHECSSYYAPKLDLSWYPQGTLHRFGQVYPAHEGWEAYIEEAARVQWEGAEPRLDAGSWSGVTGSEGLIADIRGIEDARADSPCARNARF